ncbi:hypothetical protein IJ103_02340 [Candidatus Saccharibacteria bacterium]|nr:hypothetical protein [Candidatus Saccharibacteria bacterium]
MSTPSTKPKRGQSGGGAVGLVRMSETLLNRDTATEKSDTAEEQKRKAIERYQENKRMLLEREQNNYSEIILLKDKPKGSTKHNEWWNAFGHSANLLVYYIAENHPITFRKTADTDYGIRSEEGVVSIRDLNKFCKSMKAFGYTKGVFGAEMCIIKLGRKLTPEDYNSAITVEQRMLDRVNGLILPNEMMVELSTKIGELDGKVHEVVRKMDAQSREVYADEMEKITTRMVRHMVQVERGSYPVNEFLDELLEEIEELWGYLKIITNRRAYGIKKITQIGEKIEDVRIQVMKELKKQALKKVDERIDNGAKIRK